MRVALVAIAIFCVLWLVSCHNESTPFKIGLMTPTSGQFEYYGNAIDKAVSMMVRRTNLMEDGLLNHPVELYVMDDTGSPTDAVDNARELVNLGVKFVIGSFSSDCTEAAAEVFNLNNVLQITPSSTATKLSEKGYPLFFRMCFTNRNQSQFIAGWLAENLKATRLAILNEDTVYGGELARLIQEEFQAAEGEVVATGVLRPELDNYSTLLDEVKAAGATSLFFAGTYQPAARLLVAVKAAQMDIQVIMPNACNSPELVELAGMEAARGCLVVSEPFPEDLPFEQTTSFLRKYLENKSEPIMSIWPLMAVDALHSIKAGITATGSDDPTVVAAYLKNNWEGMDGITGPVLGFDEKGDREGVLYTVYEIDADGNFVPRKKTERVPEPEMPVSG